MQKLRPESNLPRPWQLPRRRALALAAAALACAVAGRVVAARADAPVAFRVIVHPNNATRVVDRSFVADAFLKKATRWDDHEVIRAVDLRVDTIARQRFSEAVLKRSVGAVRSYWQQRIFSGRDVPPPEVESDESVMAFVAKNAGGIGYVSGSAKLSGVRELAIK